MAVVYSNNASTALTSGITNSATSITVGSLTGFPTLTGSDYYYATLANVTNTKIEIVKVTAAAGTTLTVVRGQDNTTAVSFDASDNLQLRVTAATLESATSTDVSITGGSVSTATITDATASAKGLATAAQITKLDAIEASANNYSHPTGAGNEHLPSTVSQTEAGYLDGVTSAIQTQIDGKSATSHNHTGVYEPADATIVKDADIGVTVQAYDANLVSDATYVKTDENFTTADHSKLDNIEASADVTDTVNVTAAGALMDSEVTNLAQVKAFDTTDYATSAQGTTADNALPKAGGTMTGDVSLGDNVKATFGAGSDLQIYHDGGNSWIKDTGSGNLRISASSYIQLQNDTGTQTMALFNDGGDVSLRYAGAEKLATTSTGVDVTGTVNATTVDLGNWTVTESSGVLYFATSGTNKMKLDASGNLTVTGNVTAYGTV